jgi:alpha-glucosidase
VGDGNRSLKTVADYTSGGDKLNMCYTFDLLSPEFSAVHIRACVEAVEKHVGDGWICWAFSNHDVMRHVSRFAVPGEDKALVAKLALSVLASLRGSICLYQGEELGLTEADLTFEDLRDPYGIRFWPAFKGRDGCRTPMVWQSDKPYAGFSTVKPWLPVPYEHAVLAVDAQEGDKASVLNHYRAMLAFRKAYPALRDGDISFLDAEDGLLAFTRTKASKTLLFVFNLTTEPVEFKLPSQYGFGKAVALPGFAPEFDGKIVRFEARDAFCMAV